LKDCKDNSFLDYILLHNRKMIWSLSIFSKVIWFSSLFSLISTLNLRSLRIFRSWLLSKSRTYRGDWARLRIYSKRR
jgi:hypothetical protein